MRRTSEVAWFSFSRLTKYADRQLSLAVVALAPTLLAFRNDLSRVRIEIIQSFVTYRLETLPSGLPQGFLGRASCIPRLIPCDDLVSLK
jgi:hypothetical protein